MLWAVAYTAVVQYEEAIGTFGVLMNRFRAAWDEHGLIFACCMMTRLFWLVFWSPLYCTVRRRRTFTFRGQQYRYFCHWYNTTFDNERTVEVALALHELERAQGKRVLEVGNVLSHYTTASHDVLDKYEKGERVIHEDIVDYRPSVPYDLILSFSTIEHVGFDEHPQDPEKILRAEENIRRCLAPGGRALITIPVGYNANADRLLHSGKLFSNQSYLKRISRDNRWIETTKEEAFRAVYNTPYSFGNAIVVCTVTA